MDARDERRRGADLAEIEAVYEQRLAEFRRVAAAITRDRDLGCDAVQDAFARAVRTRSSFHGAGPLEAWLWRAVVSTALNARRTRKAERLTSGELVAAGNGHSGNVDADLQIAISLLPQRQRLVLFLRYYADLDYRTIAEALEISTGTVAATLNAAHATLRHTYEEVLG